MAEAFIRTMKSGHVHVSEEHDARAVINQPKSWFLNRNNFHPDRGLGYLATREYIDVSTSQELSWN